MKDYNITIRIVPSNLDIMLGTKVENKAYKVRAKSKKGAEKLALAMSEGAEELKTK